MSIFNKIKWVASIMLVFFIVIMTNIVDKDNFSKLSESVTTIYEDRIVASDIIFDTSRLIHQKQIALIANDSVFFQKKNKKINAEINNLIDSYKKTKLTEKEKFIFSEFQDELKVLEKQIDNREQSSIKKMNESFTTINQHLIDLSKIQLSESRRQFYISNKVKDSINLFTQVEIIFLIIMAIIIQIIILYKPRELKEN